MADERKPRAENRRPFVRTKIQPAENMASVVILVLLAGIWIAIAIKGRRFDPDIFNVRADSLKGTVTAVEGKSQAVRAEPEDGSAAASATSPLAPASIWLARRGKEG